MPQWRTFRPGCAYDFRFDTNGDGRVDCILRLVFEGDDAPQRWQAFWLEGDEARDHHGTGISLGSGVVGSTVTLPGLGRVWVDEAGDPFWRDAMTAKSFIDGLVAGKPWAPDAFSAGAVSTGATNVIAIVAEIPVARLVATQLGLFTTVSANDHDHWTPVQRCGRPNLAATFVDDPDNSRKYNASDPDTDLDNFGPVVAQVTAKLTGLAGTATDPEGYGQLAARALLPDVIAFDTERAASFGFAGINGRDLRDDFGAVVYSLVFNYPIRTALAPLPDHADRWPYLRPARPLPSGPGVAVPPRKA